MHTSRNAEQNPDSESKMDRNRNEIRIPGRFLGERGNYNLRFRQVSQFLHTEKYFRNLIELNGNQIVFIIFRLIWNQTDVRLVPNQLENGKYNLISVRFNKISKIFLCVQDLPGNEVVVVVDVTTLKMARKPVKLQEENRAGCRWGR